MAGTVIVSYFLGDGVQAVMIGVILAPSTSLTNIVPGTLRRVTRTGARLVCIEDLGDIDILITDKTGTLVPETAVVAQDTRVTLFAAGRRVVAVAVKPAGEAKCVAAVTEIS
ncbi:hypothetical protein K3U93_05330 [Mycobacterium malmoense]|uniref:hypothetical protein n=1 Tax=Mycobacterium malmoense TaxID=1780 RepID=UPI001594DCF8|nr:hypothetical protein [Mycobacterium malmoense]QZA20339.1 hypothetical protein K3U93_05330 [Mycobacterium malmoense]UNB97095.1 hypothetical protein H5T25_05320 [Mycobacterium malmoense]